MSIKDLVKGMTMHEVELLLKDTRYIPADKFDWSPADGVKSAKVIMLEVAQGNIYLTAAFTGRDENEWAELKAKLEGACCLDSMADLVTQTAQIVCDAIDTIPDENLGNQITLWGKQFPMAVAIMLPVNHMTYHDGQINYIQTLLGDKAFHWMEG